MIYFLRHGESLANTKKVFAGQKDDTPLTPKGIKQAEIAGKELIEKKINIIISSNLERAKETAIKVAEVLNINTSNIKYDTRISEYDMGAITGTPIRKVSSKELINSAGAEDPDEFKSRVLDFLNEIKGRDENILIVSHAGVGRMIEAAKQSLEPVNFYDLEPYPNAHPIVLDLAWLKNKL